MDWAQYKLANWEDWDPGEDHTTQGLNPGPGGWWYHHAPTQERDRILQHGLQPSNPSLNPSWMDVNPENDLNWQPSGVYVTNGPDRYKDTLYNSKPMDTWRIPHNEISDSLQADPLIPEAAYTTSPIQPELFRPYEKSNEYDRWQKAQEPVWRHDVWGDQPPDFSTVDNRFKQWGIGKPDRVIGRVADVEHNLWYTPGRHPWKDDRGQVHQDWGRGIMTPEGQVWTWPNEEMTHHERIMSLGLENRERGERTPVQFKIQPSGEIRTSDPGFWYNKMSPWIEQQITQKAPGLWTQPVDPEVYRHQWDPETGEWTGRTSGTEPKPFEAKLWHGKPSSRGILGPVRTPFWTTTHQPEAVGFSGGDDMGGSVHPVQVRFNRPAHYFAYGDWGPQSLGDAQSRGADGVVVHWPADERDPSDPMPNRTWAIALDPGTVTPGHLKDGVTDD